MPEELKPTHFAPIPRKCDHDPLNPKPLVFYQLAYPGAPPIESKEVCRLEWLPIDKAPFELKEILNAWPSPPEEATYATVKGEHVCWAIIAYKSQVTHYLELPD